MEESPGCPFSYGDVSIVRQPDAPTFPTSPTWPALACLGLAALVAGCGHFNDAAAQIARDQTAAATTIRREGALALALCRREARFAYLEMATAYLGSEPAVPRPPPFVDWFASATARTDRQRRPVSWAAYCQELNQTGALYNAGVLALTNYASATESLASSRTFDGSGFGALGRGVQEIADTFTVSSALSSAATEVGSAMSGLAGPLVSYIRARELKKILTDSHEAVVRVLSSLGKYLDALDDERVLTVRLRNNVLQQVGAGRDPTGAFTLVAQGGLLFDLATGAGDDMDRFGRHINADRSLVVAIGRAEAALVAAARGTADIPEAEATDLARATFILAHQQPEEP